MYLEILFNYKYMLNLFNRRNTNIKQQNEKRNELVKYLNLYKSFPIKNSYNSIIPLNLYTCWHTQNLPPLMRKNFLDLISNNKEFKIFLYDEELCRKFIQENFSNDVLEAYDKLIPCSYKSDLWRFCVLYINGGIYIDIKFKCVNGFKFIALTEEEYFVKDRPDDYVYTALIACLPKNKILLNCINEIVKNVKNKFYGENALYPTGPGLLGKFFSKEDKNSLKLYFKDTNIPGLINEHYIIYNNQIILKYYDKYRIEQKIYQKNKYYAELWRDRNIYKN